MRGRNYRKKCKLAGKKTENGGKKKKKKKGQEKKRKESTSPLNIRSTNVSRLIRLCATLYPTGLSEKQRREGGKGREGGEKREGGGRKRSVKEEKDSGRILLD